MYLEIFLVDFTVFPVFWGISRDFAEIPEFRGSATVQNIRSPVIGVHTCTCTVLIVVIYIIAMCKRTQQLPTLLAWENAIVFGSNNVALHFVPHGMKENVGSCGLAHVTPNNVAPVCMKF